MPELRDCGCLVGRPCECGFVENENNHHFRGCGACEDCLRNAKSLAKTGKIGKLKCSKLKTIKQIELEKSSSQIIIAGVKTWVPKSKLKRIERVSHHRFKIMIQQREAMIVQCTLLEPQILEKQKEYESRSLELSTMNERVHIVGASERTKGEYLDTNVLHGNMEQRLLATQAKYLLQTECEALLEVLTKLRTTLNNIIESGYTCSAPIIQALYRGHVGRKHFKKCKEDFILKQKVNASIVIQCSWRIYRAKVCTKLLRQARDFRIHTAAAIKIQKLFRGYQGRNFYAKTHQTWISNCQNEAALKIQVAWRGRQARTYFRELQKEHQAIQLEARQGECALTLQRVIRGYLGRKRYRERKLLLRLHPKLATYADDYISRGFFWDFMDAINEDFHNYEMKAQLEEKEALTFINNIIRKREIDERTGWANWEHAKQKTIRKSKTSQEFDARWRRIASAYLLPNPDTENRTPRKATLRIRRKCFTKGKSDMVVKSSATSSGFYSTEHPYFSEPNDRPPTSFTQNLKLNITKDDISFQKSRSLKRCKGLYFSGASAAATGPASVSIGAMIHPKKQQSATRFPSRNIWRDIPSLRSDLGYLILHAVLRNYIPPSSEAKTGEEAFDEFLRMQSTLLKVRWEHQARVRAAPIVTKLREKGYSTVASLRECRLSNFGLSNNIIQTVKLLIQAVANAERSVRPSTVATLFLQSPMSGSINKRNSTTTTTINHTNLTTQDDKIQRLLERETLKELTRDEPLLQSYADNAIDNDRNPGEKNKRPHTTILPHMSTEFATAQYRNLAPPFSLSSNRTGVYDVNLVKHQANPCGGRSNTMISVARELLDTLDETNEAGYSSISLRHTPLRENVNASQSRDKTPSTRATTGASGPDPELLHNYINEIHERLNRDIKISKLEECNEHFLVHVGLRCYVNGNANNITNDITNNIIENTNSVTYDNDNESGCDYSSFIEALARRLYWHNNDNSCSNRREDASISKSYNSSIQVLIQRRMEQAYEYMTPYITLIHDEGYKTVGSLIPCPLETIGVPSEIASTLRWLLKSQLSHNPHLLHQTSRYDNKYQRSSFDPSGKNSTRVTSNTHTYTNGNSHSSSSRKKHSSRPVLPHIIHPFSMNSTVPKYIPSESIDSRKLILGENNNGNSNDGGSGVVPSESPVDTRSSHQYTGREFTGKTVRFKCPHRNCQQSFSRQYSLQIHMKSHLYAHEYYHHKHQTGFF